MLLISLEKSLAVSMNQSILRQDHMLTLLSMQGTSSNIRNVTFEHRNARSTEVMSLGTRRRDGHSDTIWTGLQHF